MIKGREDRMQILATYLIMDNQTLVTEHMTIQHAFDFPVEITVKALEPSEVLIAKENALLKINLQEANERIEFLEDKYDHSDYPNG